MGGGGQSWGGRGVRRGHLPIAALRHALFNALARETTQSIIVGGEMPAPFFMGAMRNRLNPPARRPGIFTKLRGEKE